MPDHVDFSAAELAERFGLIVGGDGDVRVSGVSTLASAGARELAFLSNPRYRSQLTTTRAGIVITREGDAEGYTGTVLLASDPYAAYARIAAEFEPRRMATAGIHPSAVIDPDATVDPSASIGPLACIGPRSTVGAGATVGPGCIVGEDCVVGPDCILVARVTLDRRVRLGARVTIHPGAVLGAAGFGLAMDQGRWLNVPQLGGVVVGDDCEIGANTTIDRGAIEDTVLEEDVRLDNQIQIGHNVHIGAHTAMAGCAAVAGSARIGRYCLIGGAAGILGHLEICDRVVVTAMSLVTSSIREPGEYSSGTPLMDNRSWRRNAARFKQLDRMARQLRDRDSD
ncbi:UDP-3-O-(3-hydroxymyristoyl)glucosamine N-acyltransferase [Novilysobacter spongiicola]|uniref:UDP-3-O-acylglucosamine N-acyltransferase n=1 Tax=Lysobacter spongiicola DSM 21749 TaxID=1122188 RepID=A0A1T4MZZ9_9GAMM|nr:UDP-3-O-(3-hydroxymyristoyl)glucosamine N-acyltransferase [Lysobacter spongiicola]SJZ72436.1 UDP-3-O-[3-hydroxymyristoyl] glucosamine N-acyltransferase [Lysobacter spongiicola DSM 21749]